MSAMRSSSNKFTKDELVKEMHKTRPPRMEGKVKNAGINPVRKPKQTAPQKPQMGGKPQSMSSAQRKDYQLKDPRRNTK